MTKPTKPNAVLAFRTITTILSVLQASPIDGTRPASLEINNNNSSEKIARRRELRILDALATLLVRDNEVTAVVSKRGASGEAVEVVACGNIDASHDSPPDPSRPPEVPQSNDALTYLSHCNDPTVMKPQAVNISIYDPLRYVLEVW